MLKRLIPDTVAGRTLLVLIFGLVVSHVLSMALYFTDRTTALLLTGGEHIADRVATIGRIIEKTPPSDRGRIIELAEDRRLRIRLSAESAIDPGPTNGWRTQILRSKVQSHLDSVTQQSFRVRYLHPEAVTATRPQDSGMRMWSRSRFSSRTAAGSILLRRSPRPISCCRCVSCSRLPSCSRQW